MSETLLIAPLVAGAVGLVIAVLLYFRVKARLKATRR